MKTANRSVSRVGLVVAVALLIMLPTMALAQDHRSRVAAESLQRGIQTLENRDGNDAEKHFLAAYRAEPMDPAPLLHLARLHDQAGNDLSAMGYYRAYLAAAPQSASAAAIRERLTLLDAAAEKRGVALLELASGALRAMPAEEKFAYDPSRDSLPWLSRYARLLGLRNDVAAVEELLTRADLSWRDNLRLYFSTGRMAVGDLEGSLRTLERIEDQANRWQGYCLAARIALRPPAAEHVRKFRERIRAASRARGELAEQPVVCAGENSLTLFLAETCVNEGRYDEARALFRDLPEFPSADNGLNWFLTSEHDVTLALAERWNSAGFPDQAQAVLQRGQRLLDVISRGKQPGRGLFGSEDPTYFKHEMRQQSAARKVLWEVLLDALDAGDWVGAARTVAGNDEGAEFYCEVLLERAETQARLGWEDQARATLRILDEQVDKRPLERQEMYRSAALRRVNIYWLDIDQLLSLGLENGKSKLDVNQVLSREIDDDKPELVDSPLLTFIVDQQICRGDLDGATRTAERLPYENDRNSALLDVMVAQVARGDIPAAQGIALRITVPYDRQHADILLLAANAQDPASADAVDLLGPELEWPVSHLSAINRDIVTMFIGRGQFDAARHINLHQSDPVIAARCCGQIAVAQLARGETSAADATVRQTLDRICPSSASPFLALGEELARGRDILGLRAVASRMREALPVRAYRRDLLTIAMWQNWAGDARGAQQTRDSAAWSSLGAVMVPSRQAAYPEFWLNVLENIESKRLSEAPARSMFDSSVAPDPYYDDVSQRATDQKEILAELREGPPLDVFRRATGLAERTLASLYYLRQIEVRDE